MDRILTLAEAARFLKVAPVTLYRKARRGEVPAARIGRGWRFHRDQLEEWIREKADRRATLSPPPERFRHLSTRETSAVTQFIQLLQSRYPTQVLQVILYGSRARGDFKECSDIDLLVIFRGNPPQKELSEMTQEFNEREDLLLQTFPLAEEEWRSPSFRSFLLLERIKREGISLYG